MGSMEDKVVLITGGSRGVGAACAQTLARAGAHVAVASKTLEPHPKLPGTLHDTARLIEAEGRDALVIQVDVRFEDQVEAMVAKTIERFGRLDALVNNAGAIFWSPVHAWSTRKYDLVNQVNARAAFLCSRAAIPHLRENGGHILMMSPPINPKAAVGKAPYLLSKIGMTLLGMAIDSEEDRVAAHALWPVTGIRTAATVNLNMLGDDQMRTVDILADATLALLERDPATSSFRAWTDEEVLREKGVSDFSGYSCVPGTEPGPMSIQMVDPDWVRA